MAKIVIFFTILALNSFSNLVSAYDHSPLQDFCVANLSSPVKLNGFPCVDPALVEANDFFFSGLHLPSNETSPTGAVVKAVSVSEVPGLNTLGLTLARLDYQHKGFFAPHFHSRASEIHVVLEGSVEVGFVTSSPSFKHYSKVLHKGDVFVVPVGLIHYQRNVGAGKSVSIAALNSQRPGNSVIPNVVFGSKPDIDSGYLAEAFALDKKTVKELQEKF